MKFLAVVLAALFCVVAVATSADEPARPSPKEALKVAKGLAMPPGVEFTGGTEQLKLPKGVDAKEWFGWGWGGDSSSWLSFSQFRFSFTYAGLSGWAYPLSYWNFFGPQMFGDGCALGIPYGGLFYC